MFMHVCVCVHVYAYVCSYMFMYTKGCGDQRLILSIFFTLVRTESLAEPRVHYGLGWLSACPRDSHVSAFLALRRHYCARHFRWLGIEPKGSGW